MRHSHPASFREQANRLRHQFLQDGDLPFTDVLTEEVLAQAMAAVTGWLDRIFSPLVTLWVFLGQVLSVDHSCAAVARLVAHRIAWGQSPCSAQTGAYCQARKRLPGRFFSDVARRAGRALDDAADQRWLWKGRRVYVYDGSAVSMPDTAENQREYPQPGTQKPGLGFPLARLAAVFSLACGAVLDLGIRRYAGKGQSELGMLRTLWDLFRTGDVLLADRLLCSWTELVMLKQRGIDSVIRTVMAQAATRHDIEPRSISFKGAVQTLDAFRPVIAGPGEWDPASRTQMYQQILDAIAAHRVADRPDRFEPRLRKRRPKHYAFLRKPRCETKRAMLNTFRKN